MRIRVRSAFAIACLLVACSSSHSNDSGKLKGSDPFGNSSGDGSGSGSGGDNQIKRNDGVGESCSQDGAMRACCDTGMQKCTGTTEFMQWGDCLDASGKRITCTTGGGPDDCKSGEFSQFCDASVPPPPGTCADSEFPGCNGDGGLPPPPSLCQDRQVNNEPEILVGYSPAMGESVSQQGQIKVWVNDEWPERIAPGEQIDASTGMITTPGDRTAKAPDGYLWEPALYIAPQTAENGGTPHFPQFIKGWYNIEAPPVAMGGKKPMMMKGQVVGTQGTAIDPAPAGTSLREKYSTELIWNVDALQLGPGTYIGEFVVGDGDLDRAVGCVTIVITR
jgi:hypothetical protein